MLTGINLGCFRDRGAGYDLPRLVREAGATPGLARLRLSSIEINHVDDDARRRAARDADASTRHLHVPLQSGDDGVLRAMRRRYTTRTYLRRLEPLAGEFNLTTDVIVGFPAEDEAAFAQHAAHGRATPGITKVHVFPYSPRPGTVTAGGRPRPAAGEEGARRAAARALARAVARGAGSAKVGSEDSCSSTGRAVATATTTRRGSSMRRSASSCASAQRR